MAENNDARLEIEVVGVGNEKSGEQSVKDIQKGINKASDKGRIKVPVDITVPIDNTKTKLTKAQKDITSELSKMMTKGFSASGKDIDALVSKFDKFTKALDAAGKGRQNKIYREIRKQVEELQKSYRALKSEMSTTPTKVSKSSSKKAPKKTAEDRYLDKQEEYSRRSQGAGKRKELYKELDYIRENKSPGSLGNRIIRGVATKQTLQETEYAGSYPSGFARQMAKSRREARKRELASLKVERNKEKAEQRAKDLEEGKVKYETKRRVIDKKPNGQIDVSYEDAEVYNKKPKQYTNEENNELKRDVTTNELAKILGGIEHKRSDVSIQLFKDYLDAAFKFNEEAGKNNWKVIQETLEKTLNRYRGDKGTLGITDGTQKGVFAGHSEAVVAIQGMLDYMEKKSKEPDKKTGVTPEQARQLKELAKISAKDANKYADELLGKGQQNKKSNTVESNSQIAKEIAARKAIDEKTFAEVRKSTTATEKQANINKIENVREAVSDSNVEKTDKENKDINRDTARAVKTDETTGFNTNSKSDELISLVRSILQQLQLITPEKKKTNTTTTENKEETDTQTQEQDKIAESIKTSTVNDYSMEMKKAWNTLNESIEPIRAQMALVPVPGTFKNHWEGTDIVNRQRRTKEIEKKRKKQLEEEKVGVDKSNIYASPFRQGFWKKIEGAFESLTGATRQYEEVLRANAEDQDKLAAERIKTYGLNNGRNPNDTGDIAGMRRILQLYRTNKASIEQNPELMQKIQLTKGREVDTTEITKALNKALSGKRMEKAQNGGGFLKNAFGFMTGGLGYAVMPSLEKSRAQADGLNQVLGNVNKALQSVLINIQTKETELSGMVESGQAKFDKNGYLMPGSSSAAYKTLADLEEEKLVLDSIKADLLANDEIIKKTGGRFPQMVKYLNFTSPVLKENNGILRNINSGLDKNGKALKFQNRLAEILNYTYQLMSRHIGQMIKNWITMANPINLIKKAFSDFGSYDVKWQRTMNVIKINFQRIIKPAMEWIAQKLVNIIGFFDIISQRIQAAFGKIPISLFDQAGAESEQIRRNLEEAANVSLGFDELHDVGTDQSGANDLMGDIYKPQLSQDWIDMATKLGDTLGGFFKGDLGFGDVCKVILELLGKLLGTIGKMIWDWFKETSLGKWITEHWKGLLATLLTLFVGWQLLKIAGPTLLKALFGWITGGKIGEILGTLGTKFMDVFTSTQFGSDMVRGFKGMFTSGGMIGAFKSGGASLGTIFAQALVAVAGVVIAGASYIKGFDMAADDASYNIGLMESGGKEKDKKKSTGAYATSVLGGAAGGALAGLAIGGPIGAAIGAGIGAIAGVITTSLAPAIEQAEVSARNMNNELQKIEYYEGAVKGAQTQVDEFDELLKLSNDSLEAQKTKVYDLGEKYGVSSSKLDTLVQAMKDGNYNSEMAVGLNSELVGALDQLDWHYQNNASLTDKLTEAKKKLQKAELDLAIANDIEAGNFELAAARIEYAMAAGLYETDEAAKKMTQIMKETSFTESQELLKNASPELQKKWNEYVTDIDQGKKDIEEIFNKMSESERKELLSSNNEDLKKKWFTYATTTESGKKELAKMYAEMNEEERKAFTKDYSSEAGGAMGKAIDAMQQKINNASFDWSHPFKSLGSMFSGDWSWKAQYASFDVGTNYVPNDGFAYIHKGEAIIPKDENVFARQGKAWDGQMAMNTQMMNAINRLEQTISQGINVKGEFRQRGNDLVATVEKNKSRQSNTVLNNKVYAR